MSLGSRSRDIDTTPVVFLSFIYKLDGKYSERVQLRAKAFLSPTVGKICHTYYFAAR